MTKHLWICAGISVCMDAHILYAYTQYCVGGRVNSDEQLRSWNNLFCKTSILLTKGALC